MKRETEAMAGSASPRKPKVPTPTRSATLRTLLVAWRSSASTASSRAHAGAVVAHLDQGLAALLQLHPHVPGAGIERVLHQLLHHRSGALDDLARGDLIGDGVRQDGDAAGHRENLAADGGHRLVRRAIHAASPAPRTMHPAR